MGMESGRNFKLSVVCVALLLASLPLLSCFTGCGGGGAVAKKRVRLGYLNNDLHQLAFYVAQQKGYFQEEGLEVEVVGVYNSGPEEMGAFQAGALDMGYVGAAPAILAVANGRAKVLAVAQANLNGSALVASPASGVRGISDLAGRKVAVPNVGTVQDFLLRRALGKEGLSIRDIQVVYMAPPQMLAALSSSSIDACLVWEPFASQAVAQGWGKIVLLSAEIWEDHPCCLVVAGEDFAESEPQVVDAFLRAHERATAFLQENTEEVVELASRFTDLPEEVVRSALVNLTFTSRLNREGLREYVLYLNEQGLAQISEADSFLDSLIR